MTLDAGTGDGAKEGDEDLETGTGTDGDEGGTFGGDGTGDLDELNAGDGTRTCPHSRAT